MKNNWQIKKLGEVCNIRTGKKDVNQGNPYGEYPFFTCAREHTYCDEYSFDMEALLVAGNGDVGHVNYYKGKFEAYQRTYILSSFNNIFVRFLYLFLDGFLKETVSKQKLGNTMPYIKMGMLTDFEIPLPPLFEQKRIVKVLDEVFEGVEKVKVNAERNVNNAKELFESYLQSVFTDTGDDWEEKALGEVCDFFNGKAHEKVIDALGDYIVVNSKFVSSNGVKYKKTAKMLFPLFKGDIAMVMSDVPKGKTLAKCFLVDKDNMYTLNQRICIFRSSRFDKKFLYYQLNRNKYFLSFDNKENQSNLRRDDILNCPLFIPTLKQQKSIVAKLDALSLETKKLEEIYRQKVADVEELKKSVLKKAFAGEL